MSKKISTLLLLCLTASWLSAQISSFPFFENFESQTQGPTSCNPSYTFTGNTWRNGDNAVPAIATHTLDWTVNSGTTSSSNTGPSVDHTFGTASGKYIYTESSCTANREADLVSPYLDLRNVNALVLDFWYHAFGADTARMHLDIDTTQGQGAWINDIIPAWDDNLDQWQNTVVSLSAYTGMDSVRIRFRGTTMVTGPGSGFTSDFGLDDILIYEPIPVDLSALAISGLSSGCGLSTQTVSFSTYHNGNAAISVGDTIMFSYQLNGAGMVTENFVVATAVSPGDTIMYTFTTPANFSTPGTYLVEVWSSIPADSAMGNDTASVTINSIPILSAYPEIYEDFENGNGGWTQGGTGTFELGMPANTIINSAASGSNAWVTNLTGTYSANEDNWVESPCFDLSQYCNPYLRLSVWWNAENSWDGSNVQYSTDGGATWTLIGTNGDPYNWYNDNTINGAPGGSQIGWTGRNSSSNGSGGWVTANHSLPALANNSGVIFRVFFGSDGSVQDEGFGFDDFLIYDNVNLGNNVNSCSGSSVNLTTYSTEGETILWSTGDTTADITVTTTGWYSVTVDADSTCGGMDSIYVYIQDSIVDALIPDSSVCGNTYDLMAEYIPNSTYYWSTGDTTSTMGGMQGNWITVPSSGTYGVAIVNVCGTITDSVALTLLGAPTVSLGQDFAACDMAMLDAGNPGNAYMWTTGDTVQMITVMTSGTYGVVVTDGLGCTDTDDVMVTINASPVVNAGPDTSFCTGTMAMLSVANAGSGSYLWSNGDSTSSTMVAVAGTYDVICTDSNGCSGMDTVVVTEVSAPSATFTFTPGAAGLTYDFTDGSTGATSWAWDFGDGNTSTSQNPTHTYTASGSYTVMLTVTNSCGTDSSVQTITVVSVAEGFGNGLNVFPNPNSGEFHITFDNVEASNVKLEVVNLLGQVMHAETLSQVYSGMDHKVSLGEVAKGYYFVRITAGENVGVKRISVK